MRSVVIPNCSYEVFVKIRNALLKTQPHGLISDTYSNDVAYFRFWDSQYVPLPLLKFAGNDQRDTLTTLEGIELPEM